MPSTEEIVATGSAITAFVTGAITGIVKAVQVSARLAAIEQELKTLRSQTDAAKIEQLRAAADSDPPDDSDAIVELRTILLTLRSDFEAHRREAHEAWQVATHLRGRLGGYLEGKRR